MRVLELFAGAGGLALGFEQAGFESVLLVENNRSAVATLRANRPRWNVLEADIKLVDFFGVSADVVTGGFPCQPFSFAGKQLGLSDTRGTLFYEFARAIAEVQPKYFVAENVAGLVNHDQGRTFSTIRSMLEDLGYFIKYRVLHAEDYGVPQKRHRLFIVGYRADHYEFPVPEYRKTTLRDALKDVPHSLGATYSGARKAVLDLVPPGGYWRDLPDGIRQEYARGVATSTRGGTTGMARRLAWDGLCPTILCSPSGKMTERCHPSETRPLTVRESARIQTFPDDWVFEGTLTEQYKQIGNAVPVLLARRVAESLLV